VRRALLQVEVQVFRTAERRVREGGKGGRRGGVRSWTGEVVFRVV